MTTTLRKLSIAAALATIALLWPADAGIRAQGAGGAGIAVPADLKPLLATPTSEMRLVVTRYNADRNTLSGDYANAGRGGGGGGRRGGGAPAAPGGTAARGGDTAAAPAGPVPVSANKIARLKRFEMDWQAALAKIDIAKLSAPAKSDLENLKATVMANFAQLDVDAAELGRLTPLTPFAAKLVQLIEARINVETVDGQKAAGAVTDVTREILALKTSGDLRGAKNDVLRAADQVDALRAGLTEWYGFYNAYDPLFTWWMGLPQKKIEASLTDYATYLREKIAPADQAPPAPPAKATIAAAPAQKFAEVPDLNEIIGLSQDEMRDIVDRFNASRSGGGRGGRQGGGNARGGGQGADVTGAAPPPAPAVPDNAFYDGWLTSLKTLDFDKLTRNAQVDYLYIKWTAETEIKRAGEVIPPGPPRKADTSDIQGHPRGRTGLIRDLADNMIPYTPEQLIVLANKEFAWCEEEMKKASRAAGFGDDWKKALEHTKQTAVPPGGQPRMIMDLIDEAVAFLRTNDLITVPSIAAETVHMTMMTPQAQLTSPFFLGGVGGILVSYPTDTMDYDARLQSMRGNNPGFSHATAFHETIPGHLLVGYLGQRFNDYRPNLRSGGPFYGEGWPLYWELTMYELGFDKTPEQKIGALFWRMHRCARIIFSLNFHMGLWSPQESVDFLVEKVGHERDNAIAEVRRSFESAQYANQPLYQAAYLLGGLQFRGLRKQLVDSKIMTNKQFHDEILRQGGMPIALIRLAVTREKLTRDMDINWKFYGELPEK